MRKINISTPLLIFLLGTFFYLNSESVNVKLFYLFIFVPFFLISFLKKSLAIIISNSFLLFFAVLIVYEISNTSILRYYKNLNEELVFKNKIEGLKKKVRITTDNNGFRNNGYLEIFEKKIILIGGSTIYQGFHSDKETTAGYLQKNLIDFNFRYNVINTGIPGARSKHHVDHLNYFKNNEQVKIFLILVGANDITHYIYYFFDPNPWYKFFNADNILITRIVREILYQYRNKSELNVTADINFKDDASNVYNQRGMFNKKKKKSLSSFEIEKLTNEIKKDIEKISKACEKTDKFCVIINQPTIYDKKNLSNDQVLNIIWGVPPFQRYSLDFKTASKLYKIVNTHIKNLRCKNCSIIDLNQAFNFDVQNFTDEIHFSQDGIKLSANLIWKHLIDNEILRK